ncbi:MAG: hypothetical protein LBR10_13125 [Prevotellaceae bacterium]|jgi:cell division protein FtsB|nr:hypothetical protein [Prevotellaceae bacterium]
MAKQKKESFFWTSYSDMMTSLFFVMLVLFVLTIVLLHNKMVELEAQTAALAAQKAATEEQLKKIKEIEESIKNIDSKYFEYDATFKRHTLKNISVSFPVGSSDIYTIPQSELNKLSEVGRSIREFVGVAIKKNPDVKYLLIVEGQSSRDNYSRNYELSYERALALVKYWLSRDINFNPQYCEVLISGSGQESPFRVEPDSPPANQRFIIHILPKPGIIK